MLALLLSAIVAVAMPVVYFVVPFAAGVLTHSGRDGDGYVVSVVVLALIGAAAWIAALTLSIRALSHAQRTSTSRAPGSIGIVLCVLGLFTGAFGWFWGLVFGAGGGPH